jgi:plasmid stabilization system protein ParE
MILLLGVLVCTGCASVSVTKTAKGFYSPTQADDIEILMTRTDRDYIELATVATANWNPSETAKMHNAMRAKTAPLGANAVIILESGIIRESAFSSTMWTSGVAIRYKNDDEKASSQ